MSKPKSLNIRPTREEAFEKALYEFACDMLIASRAFHEKMTRLATGKEPVGGNDGVKLGTRTVEFRQSSK